MLDDAADERPRTSTASSALTPGLSGYARDRRRALATQVGGHLSTAKATHSMQFDGMSVQQPRGDIGLSTQYRARRGNDAADQRHLRGKQRRRSADQHGAEGGGNSFAGRLSGLYTSSGLQSDNLSDGAARARLTTVNKVLYVYDATLTLGGPIKKDKLWFFGSLREWGNDESDAGLFWNKTQGTPFYTPDLARPADQSQLVRVEGGRVTWQASQRNKVNFFADIQDTCICRCVDQRHRQAPEAITRAITSVRRPLPGDLDARRSRAGCCSSRRVGVPSTHVAQFLSARRAAGHISILEQSTGIRYNAPATYAIRGTRSLRAAVLRVVRHRLARVQGRLPDRGRHPHDRIVGRAQRTAR